MNNKDNQVLGLKKEGSVKRVVGVISGKGGVGKSFVTARLASIFSKKGYNTAILDADITGPSIPKCFGLKGMAIGDEDGINPVLTKSGIQVISVNLLLDSEETPVVWRGPIIAGTVRQFWSEIYWDDVEYMFVDMPPGTGDVPLTVFQSLPVDGIVIVTSPQELVSMIVKKAVNMANSMKIPILGIVENYSYMKCPHCDEVLYPFGESKTEDVAVEFGLPVIARIPFDTSIAKAMDSGNVEELDTDVLKEASDTIEFLLRNVDHGEDDEENEGNGEKHRIALALVDERTVGKFADAKEFLLVDTVGSRVVERNKVAVNKNNEMKDLKDAEVDTVICSGINHILRENFESNKIAAIPVLKTPTEEVIANFLAGNYKIV